MWKPTLLVCGFFWPLCTFHPHNHRSQRLKNQQSKPLHKTSQILVWNTGESRVKFTKLWISDRFLKILSSLSWKALIVTCDAFRVCCGLVAICLNDTNWNNLLAWKTNKPVSQCKWSKGFINPWPGGVSPSVRGLVWRFLFGMYPCSSTALERSLLQEQLVVRYRVMKRTWQRFLPSAVRMHLNGTDGKSRNMQKLCHNKAHFMAFTTLFTFFFKMSDHVIPSPFQLSWWQQSGTLTRGRHRPSNRPRTSQRRSGTDWPSWSFRHRLDELG